MSCIRVGSVGIGGIPATHLPGIERSPDLKLVAVCDIDLEALRYAQEKYGIDEAHCFYGLPRPHQPPGCGTRWIFPRRTTAHYEVALAAAEAGKPYAVEKPIVMTGEQGSPCAGDKRARRKEHGVLLYRFKALARYAKIRSSAGSSAIFIMWTCSIIKHGDCRCATRRLCGALSRSTGSGALGDLGSHALDLVRFVTGKEYKRLISHHGHVCARARKAGQQRHGRGGRGRLLQLFCGDGRRHGGDVPHHTFRLWGGNYQTMEIYGSRGAIQYELDHAAPDVDEIYVCMGRSRAGIDTFTSCRSRINSKVDQMQSFADIILGKADGKAATIEDGRGEPAPLWTP